MGLVIAVAISSKFAAQDGRIELTTGARLAGAAHRRSSGAGVVVLSNVRCSRSGVVEGIDGLGDPTERVP